MRTRRIMARPKVLEQPDTTTDSIKARKRFLVSIATFGRADEQGLLDSTWGT